MTTQRRNLIRILATCALSAAVLAAICGASQADWITFSRITSNASSDVAGQLSAEVTSVDATHVSFTFYNTAAVPSSITDIYFDDGAAGTPNLLSGISSIVDFGTIFGIGATPANLPAGNSLSPQFSADFSADSENHPPTLITNGVDQSTDHVSLAFLLKPAVTLNDVLAGLNNGSLRVGLHVQAIGDDEHEDSSDSFVNPPGHFGAIPEPATLSLVAIGAGLGLWRRRR